MFSNLICFRLPNRFGSRIKCVILQSDYIGVDLEPRHGRVNSSASGRALWLVNRP